MGLAGVRVRVAGDDFHLLAEQNSPQSAQDLVALLTIVRDEDGTLRLRPRTAPPEAEWTGRAAEDLVAQARPGPQRQTLTGDETPGTAWRDVPGSAISQIEAEEVDAPVALWHWAVGTAGSAQLG